MKHVGNLQVTGQLKDGLGNPYLTATEQSTTFFNSYVISGSSWTDDTDGRYGDGYFRKGINHNFETDKIFVQAYKTFDDDGTDRKRFVTLHDVIIEDEDNVTVYVDQNYAEDVTVVIGARQLETLDVLNGLMTGMGIKVSTLTGTSNGDGTYGYTFTHNLNNTDVIVQAYQSDGSGGYDQVTVDIKIVDANEIELTATDSGDIRVVAMTTKFDASLMPANLNPSVRPGNRALGVLLIRLARIASSKWGTDVFTNEQQATLSAISSVTGSDVDNAIDDLVSVRSALNE
jgi:hypothetical protein